MFGVKTKMGPQFYYIPKSPECPRYVPVLLCIRNAVSTLYKLLTGNCLIFETGEGTDKRRALMEKRIPW